MARDSQGVRGISGYIPKEKTPEEKVPYYTKEIKGLEYRLSVARRLLAAAQRDLAKNS